MSEQFYEKLLSFGFGAIILILLIVLSMELLFFYVSLGSFPLFLACSIMSIVSAAYGIRIFLKFKGFKQNLNLYFPTSEKTIPLELNLENEELMLKVALLYANAQPFHKIARAFKLRDQNEARRLLYQALAFLLKFYDEHKEASE